MSKQGNIKTLLSAATASLLCQTTQAGLLDSAELDATTMRYIEKDRVTVQEEIVKIRKTLDNADALDFKVAIDAMSGASPNGAAKTSEVQTFTTPSGATNKTSPWQTPTYPFNDERVAFSAGWEQLYPLYITNTTTLHYATEGDYQSKGISDTLSKEFNNRMTTFSLGFGLNRDTVESKGGIPVGLAPESDSQRTASKEKEVTDVMLGLTHIINRRSLISLTLGKSTASGYLTDPYKLISYLDDATGNHMFTGAEPHYYEKRPSERNSSSANIQYLHQFTNEKDVLRVNYQYYQDDWDITSHTVDLKLNHQFNNGQFIEPHLRYYEQTAADFYHYALVDGPFERLESRDITDDPSTLDYASADYRLGALTTKTAGVTYAYPLQMGDGKIAARVEYIEQSDKQNRFDSVFAYVAQLILSLRF